MANNETRVIPPGQVKKEKIRYPRCDADVQLEQMIRAKYNVIYVVSFEERLILDALEDIVEKEDVNYGGVQVWDAASGLRTSKGIKVAAGADLENPDEMLSYISKRAKDCKAKVRAGEESRGPLYVLCDLFRYLESDRLLPVLERKLRALSVELRNTAISVVIISPKLELPISLEKNVTVLDYPMPGPEQLTALVNSAKKKFGDRGRVKNVEAIAVEPTVRALLGLTMHEAEDAIARSVVVTDTFDIPTLLEIKRQIIRKGEILDYVYSSEKSEDVGGMVGLKRWLKTRKKSFADKAKDYGLPAPKGVLLVGPWGTGKSLFAKCIATEFQFPLIKLDMGRVFGKFVGDSENNVRKALQLAEAIAPCVLFIDELDKAMAGGGAGFDGDNGTTKRVIGTMLDWMQEKTAPVFVVGAANIVQNIDPAFMRKGRFDEVFFVDLPTAEERADIFRIHIKKKRGNCKVSRDPNNYDLGELVNVTDGYSGAEIEACVLDAMNEAFSDNEREFTTDDILSACHACTPLSQMRKQELDRMREQMSKMRKANALPEVHGEDGDRFDTVSKPPPSLMERLKTEFKIEPKKDDVQEWFK